MCWVFNFQSCSIARGVFYIGTADLTIANGLAALLAATVLSDSNEGLAMFIAHQALLSTVSRLAATGYITLMYLIVYLPTLHCSTCHRACVPTDDTCVSHTSTQRQRLLLPVIPSLIRCHNAASVIVPT